MTAARISVIIPALNEEEAIGTVVRSMPWDRIAECIVVDNGSTDGTAAAATAAGARVIRSPRGYGHAQAAGGAAALAASDVLVFMDGDGSDDVQDFDRIAGPVLRGEADFVLGSRLALREAGSMLGSQVFASRLIGALVRILYRYRFEDMGSFRAIRRDAFNALGLTEMTYGWNLEMQVRALQQGLRILEIPVHYRRRIGGQSKVSGDVKASLKAAYRILGVLVRTRPGRKRTA